ncbi:MAG: hypothetical protein IKE77_02025 [Erysipelotrichaceae bacterium]|nr:hypothetical protein [Erysipelotrichaceae bacterium]
MKCSLKIILKTLKEYAQLPQISKSDYYCVTSKKGKGLKNDEVMNRIINIYYFHKGRLKGLTPFDYRNQALMNYYNLICPNY